MCVCLMCLSHTHTHCVCCFVVLQIYPFITIFMVSIFSCYRYEYHISSQIWCTWLLILAARWLSVGLWDVVFRNTSSAAVKIRILQHVVDFTRGCRGSDRRVIKWRVVVTLCIFTVAAQRDGLVSPAAAPKPSWRRRSQTCCPWCSWARRRSGWSCAAVQLSPRWSRCSPARARPAWWPSSGTWRQQGSSYKPTTQYIIIKSAPLRFVYF